MTPRFFVDQALDVVLTANQTIVLPETISHHALRVLRMNEGDKFVLFNGNGKPYLATLEISGKKALAKLVSSGAPDPSRAIKLRLIQGLSSAEKMDWTIEKATELGVDELVVFSSERSKIRLNTDRLEKKLERWRELIAAACGQCGRNTLPTICETSNIASALATPRDTGSNDTDQILIFTPGQYPSLMTRLRDISDSTEQITLIVGPESGFSETETRAVIALGAKPTSLGWRVLRTETAGPAVLAITDTWLSEKA